MRTATLVGGLATGALLLTGTAAQAADTQATPEMLGGLPQLPTSAIPGLDAIPTQSVPGLDSVVPAQGTPDADARADAKTDARADIRADKKNNRADRNQPAADQDGPVGDLLGNLGGGLPVPLPF